MISAIGAAKQQYDDHLKSLRELGKTLNHPLERFLLDSLSGLSKPQKLALFLMKPSEREATLIEYCRLPFYEWALNQKADRHKLGGKKVGEKSHQEKLKRHELIRLKEAELIALGHKRGLNKTISNQFRTEGIIIPAEYVRKARASWKPNKKRPAAS